ncbi:ABC transporter permease [Negativibacillus massiliensis]|uniref:ABC transporter permease n=1 Tax=Negativibacillus massiliensis TaxID=1871035 RepID=UPI0023F70337|nr:ABC transporter permease [Negativibacillus massiliensis]
MSTEGNKVTSAVEWEDIPAEKFQIIGTDDFSADVIARPKIGYWADAWRRLKENKIALIALIVLLILVFMVTFGPMISGYSFEQIDTEAINQRPSAEHWFGTDSLGRDLFARVWQGGRVSIIIGIVGAVIASVLGCIYGGIASYFGGIVDDIMMRIVEVLLSIPYLIIVILISVVTDSKSMGTMMLALTLTGWCGIARLVRGQMLQIKTQEYVLAANALGVSPLKTIMRHMIPNTIGIIIVAITFDIPGYIFSEAFLSYIGLGIQPPNTSWGALASAAQQNFMFYPYQLFFPSIMIALTMLSFTLLGDGLRDALDPKLRK